MKKKSSKKKISKYKLTEAVSVVSHQLKTPLSAIKGYLEVVLLGDLGKLNKEQKEYLENVLENTKQMINLVKDLLDVARIEAGQMELKPEPTDLAKIAKEMVNEFSSLARAKNCELSFEVLDKLPLLNIDPVKIKQVMVNIISNAIFYNKRKGQVKVSLSRRGKRAIFCCQDTGVGIVEEEKDKIFTKFYRSERVVAIATGGSGLGLFISKAIIEKSGGKIWFKSKEGKGSTFCFSLPIK
ncbi:MAG: sensor histidine kinase [Candidatus Aminicenantia bacterium]